MHELSSSTALVAPMRKKKGPFLLGCDVIFGKRRTEVMAKSRQTNGSTSEVHGYSRKFMLEKGFRNHFV